MKVTSIYDIDSNKTILSMARGFFSDKDVIAYLQANKVNNAEVRLGSFYKESQDYYVSIVKNFKLQETGVYSITA